MWRFGMGGEGTVREWFIIGDDGEVLSFGFLFLKRTVGLGCTNMRN
jgi:hypothetical protein